MFAGSLLAMLILTLACQRKPTTGEIQKALEEIHQLRERLVKAFEAKDLATIGDTYARDTSLVVFDPQTMMVVGWENNQKSWQEFFTLFDTLRLQITDSRTHVVPRALVAWDAGTWRMEGVTSDGQTVQMEGRHTTVYEKREGRWVIVHDHASVPLPPSIVPGEALSPSAESGQ